MSILAEILRRKQGEVAAAQKQRSAAALAERVRCAPPVRSLRQALARRVGEPVRAMAEIKRASPSAGPIRPGADPEAIAREYAAAGAAAISVLTDEHYFAGHLSFLPRVREAAPLPILRKDFIIDPYQVGEARAFGADAVLLITAALDPTRLAELAAAAAELHMDALMEVHSAAEVERALAAHCRLLGVNHRDLTTFALDPALALDLRPLVPAGVVVVAESGIRGPGDVRRLAAAGVDAILVGEHLMRAPSPGAALAELLAYEAS